MDSIYVDVLLFVRHLLGTRRYRRSQAHSEHQPFLSCGGFCLLRHFSMTSLLVSRRILNSKYFKQRETQSKHVIRNGALVVVSNMLLAGACEIFFNIADPDFTEDLWGTSFLFGILASLMALILLSMHYSARVIQKNKENAALQKKIPETSARSPFRIQQSRSSCGHDRT